MTREDRDLLIGSVNGEILLSPAQWKAADLNGDGKVDMDDCAELTMLEREGE
ncbi:dockerin type I domain-containing protein [Ruminococcus champanellensis]|uniref:dockerin type I domain-containing protein n=1 Tax=Ruminococcus champanellensis TaxID=1161942 RepID=UPI003C6E8535